MTICEYKCATIGHTASSIVCVRFENVCVFVRKFIRILLRPIRIPFYSKLFKQNSRWTHNIPFGPFFIVPIIYLNLWKAIYFAHKSILCYRIDGRSWAPAVGSNSKLIRHFIGVHTHAFNKRMNSNFIHISAHIESNGQRNRQKKT